MAGGRWPVAGGRWRAVAVAVCAAVGLPGAGVGDRDRARVRPVAKDRANMAVYRRFNARSPGNNPC
ncbi:hypothetical protein GCM10010524_42350 [Streptomyces mexicanus]